jgi:hypothetical protein
MNATIAHPIMHSTITAPSRRQARARPQARATTAMPAITSHKGTSHHNPSPGGSWCISQVTTTTRDSDAPFRWPADTG